MPAKRAMREMRRRVVVVVRHLLGESVDVASSVIMSQF